MLLLFHCFPMFDCSFNDEMKGRVWHRFHFSMTIRFLRWKDSIFQTIRSDPCWIQFIWCIIHLIVIVCPHNDHVMLPIPFQRTVSQKYRGFKCSNIALLSKYLSVLVTLVDWIVSQSVCISRIWFRSKTSIKLPLRSDGWTPYRWNVQDNNNKK